MSDMYAVKKDDMPKIYRAAMALTDPQDHLGLSAIPDAVINEQADGSAELGLNPSDEVVRGMVEQVRVAFRLPSTKLAGDAAWGLWVVYHSAAQAMERLGAKTSADRLDFEIEAMSVEVLRKIMVAQLGDEAGG